MDYAEAFRRPLRPLEIVEQRPYEIAAQIGTVPQRLQGSDEMDPEIVDPFEIVNRSIGTDPVIECRPVLGDIDRRIAIVIAEIDELTVETLRLDRPAHRRQYRTLGRRTERQAKRTLRVILNVKFIVIIHSQKIDRLTNIGHVIRTDHESEFIGQSIGIFSLEQRIETCPLPQSLEITRCADVLFALGDGANRFQAHHRSELVVGTLRAKRMERQSLRQILMVHGGDVIRPAPQPGGMVAKSVADQGMHRGLVQHDPVLDPVAEAARHDLRIIGEPMPDIAIKPAAPLLKRLRQIPVIEADPRRDPACEASVRHAVVKVQSRDVDVSGPRRNDPRPRCREAIAVEPALRDQIDIVWIAVVVVRGDIGSLAAVNIAFRAGKDIPDRFATAVGVDRPFDLVGGRRYAPAKLRAEVTKQFIIACRIGARSGWRQCVEHKPAGAQQKSAT